MRCCCCCCCCCFLGCRSALAGPLVRMVVGTGSAARHVATEAAGASVSAAQHATGEAGGITIGGAGATGIMIGGMIGVAAVVGTEVAGGAGWWSLLMNMAGGNCWCHHWDWAVEGRAIAQGLAVCLGLGNSLRNSRGRFSSRGSSSLYRTSGQLFASSRACLLCTSEVWVACSCCSWAVFVSWFV
jgi:hypothetical protein